MNWLPVTKKELIKLGWDYLDVILVSGDAYVDHPAFGTAVIGRIIEKQGFRVAVIPQPNWRDDLRDFKKLGLPRLFFGVTSGCMDSMINHYTARKRLRSDDAYTAGGKAGLRPDYAVITYTRILKKLFPEIPVIIGGIEASMRRLTHYDYWSDQLKPSILLDSGADLLVYGMGELPLLDILKLIKKGVPFSNLKTIPQTAFVTGPDEKLPVNKNWQDVQITSHEQCLEDKKLFARNFKIIEEESNKYKARRIIQKVYDKTIVINPPYPVMTEQQIDASFDLPYTRLPHPKYKKKDDIPAYKMIRHSITLHRGCFGGCSFCTISAHQGKMVTSRSEKSIMHEVDAITAMEDFKGYISDMGGPTANMYKMEGINNEICRQCTRPSCIYPSVCQNLNTDHHPLIDIYRTAASHDRVKKVFVTSGIRYDLLFNDDRNINAKYGLQKYIDTVIRHHISGRLKIAPEHSSDTVLKLMRKPSFSIFKRFKKVFDDISRKNKLNQQLIPYFISGHPGCSLTDMAELAVETKNMGFRLEQVQDFTPTPMTLATVMYYSGFDPYTLKPVSTAGTITQKMEQNRFLFWYKKENKNWIIQKLKELSRSDLIKNLYG
ncbi:MAG: YgiQ family radical SAM protein [Calditrichaceae bacterium]|nr:YgiQ family radical SAM protein [Calditrichaceae bacterium]MBN2707761.1 YgiQ family radical SAM protein [Calditrichaceae bacterium]RQV96395.1 MAG: YgiQ family radical SAM protein [Calditrichota bacterium]